MVSYHAPLRDMRFLFDELLDFNDVLALPDFEEVTPDLVEAILEEAAKLTENVLLPLNGSGDQEGCTYLNGTVTTPQGFKEAYQAFVEGGWNAMTADPRYGGQGLPVSLNMLFSEMMCSSNMSFSTYPGLTHGAATAIGRHASEALKERFLPNMITGRWSGTMCLTEPHCGTDLGLLRTKAVPQQDGTYKISGTKIFISGGDHDLTENIIHLVLARLPDAPDGVKGISLFLVPKVTVKPDGTLGPRNAVQTARVESKMGLHASATCMLQFEDAEGYLIGEPHRGMRAMFTMMNEARLAVGVQGLGLAETAYQSAVAYARERLQGRALTGTQHPDQAADPIIVHPDVRRMLLTMRAYTEGARALAGWVAVRMDLAGKHPDPAVRQESEDFVALLTPVLKAFVSDLGMEVTNLGIQVYGGHGYIRDNGMEQYVRDARIAQIYEGTNGIQALDLVGRKLPAHMGRYLRRFFHPVQAFIEEISAEPQMKPFAGPLAKSFGRLQQATGFIAQKGLQNPDEAGAASSEYLRLFGLVSMAYLWARTARIALPEAAQETEHQGFYQAKVDTARFFMERLLPQSGALLSAILSGGASIMDFDEAAF